MGYSALRIRGLASSSKPMLMKASEPRIRTSARAGNMGHHHQLLKNALCVCAAQVAHSRKLGNRNELAFLHGEDLRSDHQGWSHPCKQHYHKGHGVNGDITFVQRTSNNHLDQKGRDGREDLTYPLDDQVQPATEVSSDEPQQYTNECA